MNCYEAIRARRSIRKYEKGVKIPRSDIEKMLEAAMMAPSARNSRPWEFAVVESEEGKRRLMAAHPYCGMLETAYCAIVVSGLPDALPNEAFWPEDCGAAIENILLQAVDLGYGTCWCGCYPKTERALAVKEAIGAKGMPVAIIAVGKSAESPAPRGYFDPAKVRYL